MTLAQEATLRLKAQTTGVNNIAALNKSLEKTGAVGGIAGKALTGLGRGGEVAAKGLLSVENILGGVTAGFTALAGLGIGRVFSGIIDTVIDFQSQTLTLEQGLKNLGETAPGTLDAVQESASRLGEATLFNEEDFRQGSALLTSFSSIAVEQYDRVGAAAADLAQLNRTDVASSYLQLAKALEDPLRGITALGRAGVRFTEEQKELIAASLEVNDVVSAQEIILGEVETKYNAAEAAAGGLAGALDTAGEKLVDIQKSFIGVAEVAGDSLSEAIAQYSFFAEDVAPRVALALEPIQAAFAEIGQSTGLQNLNLTLGDIRTALLDISRQASGALDILNRASLVFVDIQDTLSSSNTIIGKLVNTARILLRTFLGFDPIAKQTALNLENAQEQGGKLAQELLKSDLIFKDLNDEAEELPINLSNAESIGADLAKSLLKGTAATKGQERAQVEVVKEIQRAAAETEGVTENVNKAATVTSIFADELGRAATNAGRVRSEASATVGLVDSLTQSTQTGSIGPAAVGIGAAGDLFQEQFEAANNAFREPGGINQLFRNISKRNEAIGRVTAANVEVNAALDRLETESRANDLFKRLAEGGELRAAYAIPGVSAAFATQVRQDIEAQRRADQEAFSANLRRPVQITTGPVVQFEGENFVRTQELPGILQQNNRDVIAAIQRTPR